MGDALALVIVLIGAPVGSFMAAVADRTAAPAAGRSTLWAPSRCASCGVRLGWRDLVPIVSWLALRARCRSCGAPLPLRLVAAEALGLAAGMVAVAATAGPGGALLAALWLWALLGLALTDMLCFRLPDPLTALATLAALGLAALEARLGAALLGAALAGGALMALRQGYRATRGIEGLGLGDVKLALALGAALGPAALPWLGLAASGLGLMAAALGGWGDLRATTRVPFGLFLCIAAAAIFLGQGLGLW